MNRRKPVDPQEADEFVEKRRLQARRYYFRMRDDARRYRATQKQDAEAAPVTDHEPDPSTK